MAMQIFKDVMDVVYGKYHVSETGEKKWKPKPYGENKSRYLWTDAFGVCNYLTLFHESSKEEGKFLGEPSQYLEQAALLINDVHDTLGKDRGGRSRLGQATDDHPTLGGLRIGKVHDEGQEDGDGQYFHYLTKWAFALNRMSLASKDPKYNLWAVEMLKSITPHFVRLNVTNQPHMCWKTSIDLRKVVTNSEGNLDPFDGYVTYRIVNESADNPSVLNGEIDLFRMMVERKYKYFSSNDPLDLGEALWVCHWYNEEDWAKTISNKSLLTLDTLYKIGYFDQPLSHRLAFREFGTTIGVHALPAQEWSGTNEQQILPTCGTSNCTYGTRISPPLCSARALTRVYGRKITYNNNYNSKKSKCPM